MSLSFILLWSGERTKAIPPPHTHTLLHMFPVTGKMTQTLYLTSSFKLKCKNESCSQTAAWLIAP